MSGEKKRSWKEIPIASVCWRSATEYYTGDWKTFRPERDPDVCTRCLLCSIICPDSAILWNEKSEDIKFDYNFCKGCGICANECPVAAIKMTREGD